MAGYLIMLVGPLLGAVDSCGDFRGHVCGSVYGDTHARSTDLQGTPFGSTSDALEQSVLLCTSLFVVCGASKRLVEVGPHRKFLCCRIMCAAVM